MKKIKQLGYCLMLIAITIFIFSCNATSDLNQQPETESLQQGIKACATVAYCVSVVNSAYKGYPLPSNVTFNQNLGLIYIKADPLHPLPFNHNYGDVIVSCLVKNNRGLISILFGDFNLLESKVKFYGLYTVPFSENTVDGSITALFAKQDIITGFGSDTILNLGNISDFTFNTEINRLNDEKPSDPFTVVKQNVWFVKINQNQTYNDVYDDDVIINGGGQIVEANALSGGILYHALINTRLNFSQCSQNPISGSGLIQNFKIGDTPFIDLGNALLGFGSNCNGKVHIELSTGKYANFSGEDIVLNF